MVKLRLILSLLLAFALPVYAATVHVDVGPKTCVGGTFDTVDCHDDSFCTGGTCSGNTTHKTFLDDTVGFGQVTQLNVGDSVEWDWTETQGISHDVRGGLYCVGGSDAGGPCDDSSQECVGGSNDLGNCTSDTDCPGGVCSATNCWVCTAGTNDGKGCFVDGTCTGGSHCDKSGTCTSHQAVEWDANGPFTTPHTYTQSFVGAIPGNYYYVCGVHPGAPGIGMVGLLQIACLNDGASCTQDTDCCNSHVCTAGVCSVPPTTTTVTTTSTTTTSTTSTTSTSTTSSTTTTTIPHCGISCTSNCAAAGSRCFYAHCGGGPVCVSVPFGTQGCSSDADCRVGEACISDSNQAGCGTGFAICVKVCP